ncbi:5-formyltetrahydrofolate cyclo-ligase family [seawater metagenome]|uniref:5-formyltetrahydrofolate cyclo-ligase family n=1 Tax=seawater metagenome TaxID=1561972 RepID=A0A5E8CI50_9ZZZZ
MNFKYDIVSNERDGFYNLITDKNNPIKVNIENQILCSDVKLDLQKDYYINDKIVELKITKKEIRSNMIKRRNKHPTKYFEEENNKIFNNLSKYFEEENNKISTFFKKKKDLLFSIYLSKNLIFHIYLSKDKEVNTFKIIDHLRKLKHTVLIPKIADQYKLTNYLFTDDLKLKKNKLGILEPINTNQYKIQHIDYFIIPLLAFDNRGNRIGYGGGFYDNLVKEYPTAIRIGLSFEEAYPDTWLSNKQDMKLNYCITPNKVYNFGKIDI